MDLQTILGVKDHVNAWQECARAVLIFFYGLVMLRLSGRRTFAQMSALDMVVSFIVGSSLSRVLTGSATLPGTLAAVAVLVALHVVVSHAVARSEFFSRMIEGAPALLAREGRLDDRARRAHMISNADLAEAMRREGLNGLDEMDKIKSITLEPSGEISVLKKNG
jgi:uncharacterized membrane protein YcaP (DUF421 family)